MLLIRFLTATILLMPTAALGQPRELKSEVTPGPIAEDGLNKNDEVAIATDEGDRMTVAVQVAGKGPYRFLVDTGSERTVISRQLAKTLQL